MDSIVTDGKSGRPGFFASFGPVALVLAFVVFCFVCLGVGLYLILSLIEGSPTIS